MADVLAGERLRDALAGGWSVVDHKLRREYRFPDFAAALDFVNKIGSVAEELGHHPDILLSWGRVRVETWTHDADGITEKDLLLAQRIDGLWGDRPLVTHPNGL